MTWLPAQDMRDEFGMEWPTLLRACPVCMGAMDADFDIDRNEYRSTCIYEFCISFHQRYFAAFNKFLLVLETDDIGLSIGIGDEQAALNKLVWCPICTRRLKQYDSFKMCTAEIPCTQFYFRTISDVRQLLMQKGTA